MSRHASQRGGFLFCRMAHKHHHSPVFELANLPVRFNHVARFIANANHSILANAKPYRVAGTSRRQIVPRLLSPGQRQNDTKKSAIE
jgi:hypothetical protein